MFCTNCGKETHPKDSICTHCGFDLVHVIALINEPDNDFNEAGDKLRTADEIAKRVLTLAAMISCAYGDSKSDVVQWLKQEKLWGEATPEERNFLLKNTSEKIGIEFTWKIETLVPLLWAINKIGKMPVLNRQCDPSLLKKAVISPPHQTREYISSATLRDEEEIFEEYEKVYDAHWKVRDAQINKRPVPKRLDAAVVRERHYGFNWIIGYMGQAWDEITADT